MLSLLRTLRTLPTVSVALEINDGEVCRHGE